VTGENILFFGDGAARALNFNEALRRLTYWLDLARNARERDRRDEAWGHIEVIIKLLETRPLGLPLSERTGVGR